MQKLLTALTAAAIGFGGLAATGASAQVTRTVVVERHDDHRYNHHRRHARQVCDTVWRHHHRVQRCRNVWR